jgi:Flp pilus assembly pilin Flp
MSAKKSQVSVEYLVIIGFVSFIIIGILGVSLIYQTELQDVIKFSQLEKFSTKLTSAAEEVFYAGAPSKITLNGYMPKGIQSVDIIGNDIVYNVSTRSGIAIIAYSSDVRLQGSLSTTPGIKRITLTAQSDRVFITES